MSIITPSSSLSTEPSVLREIIDPSTGDRWLLLRDPSRPGAPGQMVLVSGPARARTTESFVDLSMPWMPPPIVLKPIIRGGDPVVVEESTPVVEARFAGTALQPAVEGAQLDVRLKLSGTVIKTVALAPGRTSVVHP
jgi:hypothetical protein